jgi:hypothetical protein
MGTEIGMGTEWIELNVNSWIQCPPLPHECLGLGSEEETKLLISSSVELLLKLVNSPHRPDSVQRDTTVDEGHGVGALALQPSVYDTIV